MTPFEFGYRFERETHKSASWGGFAQGAWDVGKYMIPGVGTAYSAKDLYDSVRQGNVMGSLGNAAMLGVSLIPGAGGLLGGAARGAGKGLMRAGARMGGNMAGKALMAAGRGMRMAPVAMRAAGGAARGLEGAMAKGVQKVVPVNAATKSWTRMAVNKAVQNPMHAAAYTLPMAAGGGAVNRMAGAAGAGQAAPMPAPQMRPMAQAGLQAGM